MVSYMISTVKIGILNIIESQTLRSSSHLGRIPIYLSEINKFLKFIRFFIFHVHHVLPGH